VLQILNDISGRNKLFELIHWKELRAGEDFKVYVMVEAVEIEYDVENVGMEGRRWGGVMEPDIENVGMVEAVEIEHHVENAGMEGRGLVGVMEPDIENDIENVSEGGEVKHMDGDEDNDEYNPVHRKLACCIS
jgi:hypothetical protein